jgi:hypothetical protein
MFCSTCGHALVPGQPVCQQCGRPVAIAPIPPVPGFQFELTSYSSKLRALAVVWYIYGGLTIALGLIAMAVVDTWFSGRFHHWIRGPVPPLWLGPAILHFAWLFTIARAVLALAAGWGLMERQPWGRVVAIISAVFAIIHFPPFGLALAIWTFVILVGYRNTTLYEHVAEV